MLSLTTVLLSLFAASAHAWPASLALRASSPTCLTDAQAKTVANGFKGLIDNYSNASAAAILSPTFTDYTDSVINLINVGCPTGPATYGTAAFTSLASFQAGQGGQPNIPFTILNTWHDCSTVIVRWSSSNPAATITGKVIPITGIAALVVVKSTAGGEPFRIQTVYSEFDSGAWLYDIGVFKPVCS